MPRCFEDLFLVLCSVIIYGDDQSTWNIEDQTLVSHIKACL